MDHSDDYENTSNMLIDNMFESYIEIKQCDHCNKEFINESHTSQFREDFVFCCNYCANEMDLLILNDPENYFVEI